MTLVTPLSMGTLLPSWGDQEKGEPVLGSVRGEVWAARLQRGKEFWAGDGQINPEPHACLCSVFTSWSAPVALAKGVPFPWLTLTASQAPARSNSLSGVIPGVVTFLPGPIWVCPFLPASP